MENKLTKLRKMEDLYQKKKYKNFGKHNKNNNE